MPHINLLIANAAKSFSPAELKLFHSATKKAEAFISSAFDFDYDVDVVVAAPSFLMKTIPEDGIGARTYSSRFIAIVCDKQQAPICEDSVFEVLCHELSHSIRWEKNPEYTRNLFDETILEGLAVALEAKAMESAGRRKRQYFLQEMQNTSQEMIDNIITQLSDKLYDTNHTSSSDYSTVFYTGNERLPRWAGYRLGYYFVKKYLAETGNDINEATVASYHCFTSKLQDCN